MPAELFLLRIFYLPTAPLFSRMWILPHSLNTVFLLYSSYHSSSSTYSDVYFIFSLIAHAQWVIKRPLPLILFDFILVSILAFTALWLFSCYHRSSFSTNYLILQILALPDMVRFACTFPSIPIYLSVFILLPLSSTRRSRDPYQLSRDSLNKLVLSHVSTALFCICPLPGDSLHTPFHFTVLSFISAWDSLIYLLNSFTQLSLFICSWNLATHLEPKAYRSYFWAKSW